MYKILKEEYKNLTETEDDNFFKIVYYWLFNNNFRVIVLIRYMQNTKLKLLKKVIQNQLESKYSILVGFNAKIGKNLKIEHFIGVVIGRDVIIGKNCKIYQNVTIGQKNNIHPRIGNNVTIYPGAKVVGDIEIGNNVIIGANSVVLKSVPSNCVVAGVPAKIIKVKRGEENE